MRIGIFVSDPTAQTRTPVFNDERFSEFLALSVTETALCFTGRDEVRPVTTGQSHFQPFTNVVLNSRTRTPSAATFFHSHPLPVTNNHQLILMEKIQIISMVSTYLACSGPTLRA